MSIKNTRLLGFEPASHCFPVKRSTTSLRTQISWNRITILIYIVGQLLFFFSPPLELFVRSAVTVRRDGELNHGIPVGSEYFRPKILPMMGFELLTFGGRLRLGHRGRLRSKLVVRRI